MPVTKDLLATIDRLEDRIGGVVRTGASLLEATPARPVVRVAERALAGPLGVLHRITGRESEAVAEPTGQTPYPAEAAVEVAVDEFGAVGSLTDNTGVEPDGVKPPFPGYDKLSGDSVMRHVGESTDLPDLQVLLAYEEAHKNRKGVVQAVEARLAALGTPVS
ncbi:MAG: hypothetical protein QOE84_758 [Actinomycetota bacterium]|nr:hypothetical protein [Actinomycetota bacterium]